MLYAWAYIQTDCTTIIYIFNVHGSVHRKNVLMYVQQDATLHSFFYLETALHVSGGSTTHHQERKNCIYSIWYLSHRSDKYQML